MFALTMQYAPLPYPFELLATSSFVGIRENSVVGWKVGDSIASCHVVSNHVILRIFSGVD